MSTWEGLHDIMSTSEDVQNIRGYIRLLRGRKAEFIMDKLVVQDRKIRVDFRTLLYDYERTVQ